MSGFPPKPGTAVYRVLAYLETILPRRPRATAGMVAGELRGLTAIQVRDALEAAHEAGYVNREADVGATGRGPVFYELVRGTTGELAVGGAGLRIAAAGASASAPATAPAPREDDALLTGTGAPPHPGGVIEPVVPAEPRAPDPDPSAVLVRHPGAFGSQPLTKVVQIRPAADGFAVEVDGTPELAARLRGRQEPDAVADKDASPASVEAPAAAPAPITVGLDFASGPDEFAVALASDGRLHCWRGVVPYVFSRAEVRALVNYLNGIDLEPLLEDGP